MVNIKFYLKQGYVVEAYNCSDLEIAGLKKQFEFGDLMIIKNLYINPNELMYFTTYSTGV